MLKHAEAPGPRVTDEAPPRGPTHAGPVEKRPHLFSIAFGLLDAHVSGIDYFDTAGGQELLRLYQRRRAEHRHTA